jgi:hypothetical protein
MVVVVVVVVVVCVCVCVCDSVCVCGCVCMARECDKQLSKAGFTHSSPFNTHTFAHATRLQTDGVTRVARKSFAQVLVCQ